MANNKKTLPKNSKADKKKQKVTNETYYRVAFVVITHTLHYTAHISGYYFFIFQHLLYKYIYLEGCTMSFDVKYI